MPALSSHEGGGAWPGGAFGAPPGPLGRRSMFGDGTYSQNIYLAQAQVDRTLGTNIGDMAGPGTLAAAFDGTTACGIASGACATTSSTPRYVGKDWGAGGERCVTGFRVYGSTDQGFCDVGAAIPVTHTLQASGDGASWTDLASVTAVNALGAVVSRLDIPNTQKYRYVRMRHSGGATNAGYAEVQFFENGPTGAPVQPQDCYNLTAAVPAAAGAIVTDFNANASAAFDGTTAQATTPCARKDSGAPTALTAYIGKQWAAPKIISGFTVYGSSDMGLVHSSWASSYTLKLQGWNGSAWVDLFTSESITRVAASVDAVTTGIDTSTAYAQHRVLITANASTNFYLAEVVFTELLAQLQRAIVITGAAAIAPDPETGAAVFTCRNLVLDGASAVLAPSGNCKGLLGFVKERAILQNGAALHMDARGRAGKFGNLTALDLVPAGVRRRLSPRLLDYVVLGEGAAGGPLQSTGSGGHGSSGSAASAMQTGGGGNGGAQSIGCYNGRGGKGGPCCGGAGGGGLYEGSVPNTSGNNGGDYGGPGGDGRYTGSSSYPGHGGAGDPAGLGTAGANNGAGSGGGLLMLFSPSVSIASGCVVSADGAMGGAGTCAAGGSAGGGCVVIATAPGGYLNNGTVRASGGAAPAGSWANGGPGGAGSVNVFQNAA